MEQHTVTKCVGKQNTQCNKTQRAVQCKYFAVGKCIYHTCRFSHDVPSNNLAIKLDTVQTILSLEARSSTVLHKKPVPDGTLSKNGWVKGKYQNRNWPPGITLKACLTHKNTGQCLAKECNLMHWKIREKTQELCPDMFNIKYPGDCQYGYYCDYLHELPQPYFSIPLLCACVKTKSPSENWFGVSYRSSPQLRSILFVYTRDGIHFYSTCNNRQHLSNTAREHGVDLIRSLYPSGDKQDLRKLATSTYQEYVNTFIKFMYVRSFDSYLDRDVICIIKQMMCRSLEVPMYMDVTKSPYTYS